MCLFRPLNIFPMGSTPVSCPATVAQWLSVASCCHGGASVVLLSTLSIRPGIVFDCWLSSSLHCSMWEPVGACGGDSDPGRQGKPSYPMVSRS